jgi:hypothetical protein
LCADFPLVLFYDVMLSGVVFIIENCNSYTELLFFGEDHSGELFLSENF